MPPLFDKLATLSRPTLVIVTADHPRVPVFFLCADRPTQAQIADPSIRLRQIAAATGGEDVAVDHHSGFAKPKPEVMRRAMSRALERARKRADALTDRRPDQRPAAVSGRTSRPGGAIDRSRRSSC